MLEVLRMDYVTTARAKGLANLRVIIGHVLKNALIPVVTIAGLQFGQLLSGTVIIETVLRSAGDRSHNRRGDIDSGSATGAGRSNAFCSYLCTLKCPC